MTVSWKNKLVGAVATGAIVAGLFPMAALGAAASVLDSTATDADPAGPGYKLTINGLDEGDTADYYQIITQDFDTTDPASIGTQQWKLHANVDSDNNGIVDGTEGVDFGHKTPGLDGKLGTADDESANGLFVDELVISEYEVDNEENPTKVTSDTRQLTPKMANAIAAAISNNANKVKAGDTITVGESKKIEIENAASGMYMFVAVPGADNSTTLYKPIFVSADYYNSVSKPDDGTHQLDLTVDENGNPVEGVDYPADYVDANGVFKRSPIEIDKKSGLYDEDGKPIDLESDLAVGDTVHFTITVPVPTYSKNYKAPQFYVTDTLTDGLKLDTESITVEVKNGDSTVNCVEDTDYKIYKNTDVFGAQFKDGNDTVIDGFAVKFFSDNPNTSDDTQDGFLYTVAGAPTCTITYTGVVTETDTQKFAQQLNQMDNTATLNFSTDPNFYDASNPDNNTPPDNPNEPNDEEPTEELEDKTRHYTFDIDADVLGRDQSGDEPGPGGPNDESNHDKTSEIRKTWIDANGHVIQERESSLVVKGGDEENGKTGEYGWLEGAEFKLMKVQKHVTEGVGTDKFEALDTPVEIKFDANTHIQDPDGVRPTSDAKGYIAMKGLDAGVYELSETKAPLGYSFNPNMVYTIKITPNYVMELGADEDHPDRTTKDGKGSGDDLILESYTVEISCPKLKDDMSIDETADPVVTTCTYTLEKDDDGAPMSTLNDDGSQNPEVTIDTSVQTFGSNETAMVVNKKLGLLPATGGSGIIFYLGVGGAVALVASYLLNKTKEEDPLA